MPGSDLRRRSTNGLISSVNCRVTAGSTRDSICAAQRLRNASRLPSSPGVAQSRIAQSSVRLFSTGVPVSATRAPCGIARSALAVVERAFLTCWASSATTRPHSTLARSSAETRMVPYVVSTKPSRQAGERAAAAVEPAHRDAGREPRDLGLPVAEQAGRADDERRAAQAVLGAVQVQGDQRDRLAEPHVVGEAGAETERGHLDQPGEPLALVVAQRAGQRGGHLDRLAAGGVEQPLADVEQRRRRRPPARRRPPRPGRPRPCR